MIANLITTLLLALSVATGNVSSNVYKGGNAFNNEVEINKTKPIQRAVENLNIEESFRQVGIYTYQENNKSYLIDKWYIKDTNVTYRNDYLYIYNTTYNVAETNSSQTRNQTYAIYKITNYYQSNLTFTLRTETTIQTNRALYVGVNYGIVEQNIDQYIDMTLNSSTNSQLIEMRNQIVWQNSSTETIAQPSSTDYIQSMYTSYISLDANETINLVFYYYNTQYSATEMTRSTPNKIGIQGSVLVPETNYEIVNVPELMFTIITLPFAFYSTAFNLTIFPNTPYALNFGNLILTILAALILLYLIKKVLK